MLDNSLEHDILDLGLVYYKDIVKDPDQLIIKIEELDKKYNQDKPKDYETSVRPWVPWKNDNGSNEIFNYQKFIPQVKHISPFDKYKNGLPQEQRDITKLTYAVVKNIVLAKEIKKQEKK